MYFYRKAEEIAIDDDDPFRHDKLDRRLFLENLTRIVNTLTQPVVIALNGPWGTGKTTSLKMWTPLLRKDGHDCIYFNAWENDYADDPLICLLAAVQEQSPSTTNSRTWAKTKKLAGAVVKSVAPVAIKLLTYNAVNLEEIKKTLADGQSDVVADFTHDLSAKQIDEHVKSRKTVKAFKEALTKFASDVAQRLDGQTRSLIIIVDELDRCRPTFAVETLERIKHLFNVPHLVFILAIDLGQLAHSARSLYGEGMDAANYLRRFIDLVCDLPSSSSLEFCKSLFAQFSMVEVIKHDDDFVVTLFSAMADAFHITLRSQEQLFAELAVAARLLRGSHSGSIELAVLLILLRGVNRELFSQYLAGVRGGGEVLRFLRDQPTVAIVVARWPIIEVLLFSYSLVAGERDAARKNAFSEAEQSSKLLDEASNRVAWKAKLFQDLSVSSNALETVIRPALDFTMTVRRSA